MPPPRWRLSSAVRSCCAVGLARAGPPWPELCCCCRCGDGCGTCSGCAAEGRLGVMLAASPKCRPCFSVASAPGGVGTVLLCSPAGVPESCASCWHCFSGAVSSGTAAAAGTGARNGSPGTGAAAGAGAKACAGAAAAGVAAGAGGARTCCCSRVVYMAASEATRATRSMWVSREPLLKLARNC